MGIVCAWSVFICTSPQQHPQTWSNHKNGISWCSVHWRCVPSKQCRPTTCGASSGGLAHDMCLTVCLHVATAPGSALCAIEGLSHSDVEHGTYQSLIKHTTSHACTQTNTPCTSLLLSLHTHTHTHTHTNTHTSQSGCVAAAGNADTSG